MQRAKVYEGDEDAVSVSSSEPLFAPPSAALPRAATAPSPLQARRAGTTSETHAGANKRAPVHQHTHGGAVDPRGNKIAPDMRSARALEHRRPWFAYEGSGALLRDWVALRWQLACSWPLQQRMVPWFRYTWGELFLALLLIGVMAAVTIGSEGAGGVVPFPLIMTFATVSKKSVWAFVLGLPFERALAYHKLFAVLSVAAGAYHGYMESHLSWTGRVRGSDSDSEVATTGSHHHKSDSGDKEDMCLSGFILLVVMAALIVTSFEPVRRRLYNTFLALHMILFTGTVVMCLLHDSAVVLIGVLMYTMDVCIRYFLAATRSPSHAELTCVSDTVVRIRFPKGDLSYRGGQYMFVCVPSVSKLEWHPFSMSSSPHDPMTTMHIRVLGDWTRALHAKAKTTAGANPVMVPVFLDGSYGEPSIDIEGARYTNFLVISGGIGITPMLSITNTLLHEHARRRPLTSLCFQWTTRGLELPVAMFTTGTDPSNSSAGHTHTPGAPLLQWCPRTIQGSNEGAGGTGPLRLNVHVTGVSEVDVAESAICQGVRRCLQTGRPDLKKTFAGARAAALTLPRAEPAHTASTTRIAVLACGPERMMRQARQLCWELSDNGVAFDYHGETFNF